MFSSLELTRMTISLLKLLQDCLYVRLLIKICSSLYDPPPPKLSCIFGISKYDDTDYVSMGAVLAMGLICSPRFPRLQTFGSWTCCMASAVHALLFLSVVTLTYSTRIGCTVGIVVLSIAT
jgi:hypothetical protein